MKESDYLNPNDIKSQCDQAIHKLENDNETLDIVSKSVTAFSTDNEIKSVSFENLKQQLADYITVIDAIKSANAYDIAEFSTLKDLVGDEVLDGANIQSQMKKALDNKEFYLEKADECRAGWFQRSGRYRQHDRGQQSGDDRIVWGRGRRRDLQSIGCGVKQHGYETAG